jgi:hypothetical protein
MLQNKIFQAKLRQVRAMAVGDDQQGRRKIFSRVELFIWKIN